MPREHVDNGRVELRLKPEDKAVLARAAALERLDLTSFILRAALPRAQAVITESGGFCEVRARLLRCEGMRTSLKPD